MLEQPCNPPRAGRRTRGIARLAGLLWALMLLLPLALLQPLRAVSPTPATRAVAPDNRLGPKSPASAGSTLTDPDRTSGRAKPEKAEPPTHVPSIAQVAGVRVGWDTMGTLERRLGPGLVITGGHPQ